VHQSDVLTPNEIRVEEGWPVSNDPLANSLEPAVAGGKPAADQDGDKPPAPADDEQDDQKMARLPARR